MDKEIMVDDGSHRRRQMTPRQLQAFSNVCGNCRGLCCVRFRLRLHTKPVLNDQLELTGWEVDWEAEESRAKGSSQYASDLAYVRSNFTPVRVEACGEVTMTCNNLDPVTHKCNAYETRPEVCRIYICTSAFYNGYPPDNVEHKMEAQRPGEPFEGWVPDKTPDPLWAETIKVMLDEEKRQREASLKTCSIGSAVPAWEDPVSVTKATDIVSDLPEVQGIGQG